MSDLTQCEEYGDDTLVIVKCGQIGASLPKPEVCQIHKFIGVKSLYTFLTLIPSPRLRKGYKGKDSQESLWAWNF